MLKLNLRQSVFSFAVALTLAACTTPTPTSVPTATTAPTEPPCVLADVLPQVDALLQGSEYEADYLTINSQLTLSIWLVDPEIDPAAQDGAIQQNAQRAFLTGAKLGHRMFSAIPCARELFKAFNPMIVDRAYNGWYIDLTPARAIPADDPISDEDLIAAIQRSGMEIAYLRRTTPLPQAPSPAEQPCAWPRAHAEIRSIFGPGRRNTSAYLIAGYQAIPGSATIEPVYAQVQWNVQSPEQADQPSVLATLEQLSRSMACLNPAIDRLEVYVVDPQGKVLVYCLLPGEVVRETSSPLDPNQIMLRFFTTP
jgi:hypothetical protein